MAQAGQGDPFDLLDWFVGGLDRVLGGVGIALSPFELQLALLAAASVIGILFAGRLPAAPRSVTRWLGAVAMGFVVVSVGWRWAYHVLAPDPDFVQGEIAAPSYRGMQVALLGFRGEVFPPGPDSVDSTGTFAFHYERRVGDWPRRIRVSRPGCEPRVYAISRAALRAGGRFRFEYECKAPQ